MSQSDDSGEVDVRELRHLKLSDAEVERLADKLINKFFQKISAEVGQSILRKLGWLALIALMSLVLWLAGKNALLRP